jgi:hypothetical protein
MVWPKKIKPMGCGSVSVVDRIALHEQSLGFYTQHYKKSKCTKYSFICRIFTWV